MGNSADRAWQLSQLVEGVSTAFNPSHGSLSYVQAGHCVSKQIGQSRTALWGEEKQRSDWAFVLARKRRIRSLLRRGRRARRARFPTCGVIRVADIKLSRYKGENISLLSLPKKQPCEYQIWRKKLHKFFERSYRTNRMNPKYRNQK